MQHVMSFQTSRKEGPGWSPSVRSAGVSLTNRRIPALPEAETAGSAIVGEKESGTVLFSADVRDHLPRAPSNSARRLGDFPGGPGYTTRESRP